MHLQWCPGRMKSTCQALMLQEIQLRNLQVFYWAVPFLLDNSKSPVLFDINSVLTSSASAQSELQKLNIHSTAFTLSVTSHLTPSALLLMTTYNLCRVTVSKLCGLHKHKQSSVWQFKECSGMTLLFSTGCTTQSSTAEATESHTFLNPLDYTMSRERKRMGQHSR